MYSLRLILLVLLLSFNQSWAASNYKQLALISGSEPDIELSISKNDLEHNFNKGSTIALQLVKVSKLFTSSNLKSTSFQVKLFDISSNDRLFVSSESIEIKDTAATKKSFEIALAQAFTGQHDFEIEIYDSSRSLTNTYFATIVGKNGSSTETVSENLSCNSLSNFAECIDSFFAQVYFETTQSSKINTRVVKDNDSYRVTIPALSLKDIDSLQLDPRDSPPNSAQLGTIYADSSEAICVYVNGAWVSLAGPGTCS